LICRLEAYGTVVDIAMSSAHPQSAAVLKEIGGQLAIASLIH